MALTKSQIKAKIDKLEREKKKNKDEKKQYEISLDYAQKLVRNLRTCNTSYLSFANDSLKKYFTINGKTADDGKLKSVIDGVNLQADYLNKSVIPDIVYYKNYLQKEIDSLQVQINKLWDDYNKAEA